jgi:hypothetical protein
MNIEQDRSTSIEATVEQPNIQLSEQLNIGASIRAPIESSSSIEAAPSNVGATFEPPSEHHFD